MLKDISTKENNAVYSTYYVLSLYNLFKTGAPYPETTCIEELMTFKENPSNCDQNTVIIEEINPAISTSMTSNYIISVHIQKICHQNVSHPLSCWSYSQQ
ncbi:unnamed protein product [Pieris macdunnoughi]|uniref:Uncharacterized protein n=1 Tax=Pieris macdunnoughi TaxID=345717 RepID=A0A821R1G0_9NEOP|nr:unnamed protein product [Pieris macdunnoughi]